MRLVIAKSHNSRGINTVQGSMNGKGEMRAKKINDCFVNMHSCVPEQASNKHYEQAQDREEFIKDERKSLSSGHSGLTMNMSPSFAWEDSGEAT